MTRALAPTPLEQVLVDVSRLELDAGRPGDLTDHVAAGVDWDALLDAALWHGVESLLFVRPQPMLFKS